MNQCSAKHIYFGRCEIDMKDHGECNHHRASTWHEVERELNGRTYRFEARRVHHWLDSDRFAEQVS